MIRVKFLEFTRFGRRRVLIESPADGFSTVATDPAEVLKTLVPEELVWDLIIDAWILRTHGSDEWASRSAARELPDVEDHDPHPPGYDSAVVKTKIYLRRTPRLPGRWGLWYEAVTVPLDQPGGMQRWSTLPDLSEYMHTTDAAALEWAADQAWRDSPGTWVTTLGYIRKSRLARKEERGQPSLP